MLQLSRTFWNVFVLSLGLSFLLPIWWIKISIWYRNVTTPNWSGCYQIFFYLINDDFSCAPVSNTMDSVITNRAMRAWLLVVLSPRRKPLKQFTAWLFHLSERKPLRTKAFFDLIERKISFWWAFVLTGFSFWREFVLSGFRSHGLSFWWDFVLPGRNLPLWESLSAVCKLPIFRAN